MLDEYIKTDNNGVPIKFYKEKPSVMCEKIAKSNAFEMAGLVSRSYIEEELAMDIPHEDLTSQKLLPNNTEFFNK
jgi:hypothetical protein